MYSKRPIPLKLFGAKGVFARCVCALLFVAAAVLSRGGEFVPAGSQARFFKGTAEPSPANLTAWREIDFDDSSWSLGPMPFVYGEPLTGTQLPDMRGGYTTVYTRFAFDVVEPLDVQSLLLRVLSDDGFVAWLNG